MKPTRRGLATLGPRLFFVALLLATPAAAQRLEHGIAAGDVTATSAVLWAGADDGGDVVFELWTDGAADSPLAVRAPAREPSDFAARAVFDELAPGTLYRFRVHIETATGRSEPQEGSFRTAPAADGVAPVRFIVGGDVGGQGLCRHPEDGYRIFRAMAALDADFFVANGDMIYADGVCPAEGPGTWRNVPGDFPSIADPSVDWTTSAAREVILAHWRYNRADPHHQAFLRTTPIYAQWDDHEVVDDSGAAWSHLPKAPERAGYRQLVEAAREALFAYNPIAVHPEEPERIYRSFRWGRGVELFLLDARSYRDRNDAIDSRLEPKTMLGAAQLEWLKQGLRDSGATWKIVSSDVPLSVPTGNTPDLWGRDGWADGEAGFGPHGFGTRTGFEEELVDLLAFLDAEDIDDVVFVVTDVHFAMTLRYAVDLDGDGDDLLFHELLSGPLNAGSPPTPPQLDPTLRPVILYAEGAMWNFSYVTVEPDADGVFRLAAEIRDVDGTVRFGSRLELSPTRRGR